jgi:hypothetical protein
MDEAVPFFFAPPPQVGRFMIEAEFLAILDEFISTIL